MLGWRHRQMVRQSNKIFPESHYSDTHFHSSSTSVLALPLYSSSPSLYSPLLLSPARLSLVRLLLPNTRLPPGLCYHRMFALT
ncbi:hypothetical protein PIB30_024744 [Stylosanthes scabra]|uniref:Uncharacterized protein n=1 Tax=Stylosanthes scabra TaxID=79078 RepID=A0ABU6TAL0_9FABA|nr:hypothetical protein [Stylosanthes scabra]